MRSLPPFTLTQLKCLSCKYFDGFDEWNGYTLVICRKYRRKLYYICKCKWYRRVEPVTDDMLY